MMKIIKIGVFLFSLTVLFSCSSDDDALTNTLIADAGPDQLLDNIEEVVLDGSDSQDSADGNFE